MSWRILITCPPMLLTLEECRERFNKENLEITAPSVVQQLSEEELCRIVGDFDGIIAGDDPFTAKVLELGRKGRLKVLAKWGVGVDGIDREAAQKLGIYVSNTPGVFNDEVADVALGYLVLLARQLHKIDTAIRQGEWLKIQGASLRGKTAGIIGVGGIGKAISHRLKVLGMNLVGYDVRPLDKDFCQSSGLEQVALNVLLESADCIILTCNLTADNWHLLDDKAFSMMKDGVWIVNVARGALIDPKALVTNLQRGKVKGAALDVFEEEPLSIENQLHTFNNVIFGSHNSSNTRDAVLRVNQLVINNLIKDLERVSMESL